MRKFALAVATALIGGALLMPVAAQEELPEFIQHSDCEVDLTGETVTVYHFGDISGAYAFITQPLLAGVADALEYYNARGGVCGATLAQDNRDTGGDLAQTQAAYDYYKGLEPKPSLLLLYASGDSELLRSQLEADEIPAVLSAGSVAGLYGEDGQTPGWAYATNPLYADQIGSFCDFASSEMGMGMYGEAPTIGYISWPGAFGGAAYTPETIAYCAEKGVTILDTPEVFLPSDTDISTQVQNLVDSGANILYTNTLATGPALVAKTITDLGLEEDVQLAGVNWALDTSVGLLGRTSIGSDGLPSVNGIVGSLPFRWWSERDNPGIALVNEIATLKERTLPTQNIAYLLGFSTVDFYIELYTQTVNRVGSLDAVDGAAIKETLDSIVYSPLGIYDVDFAGGELRSTTPNRMAMMMFANATMDGVATSGDDALKIPQEDGTNIFVPVLAPLGEFAPAPDLRPGGE